LVSDWDGENIEDFGFNLNEWNMTININGVNVSNENIIMDFDTTDVTINETDDETDNDTSYFTPLLSFFTSQLNHITNTNVMCDICMESSCNVISSCGHTMCLACAVSLVKNTKTPRCPHCRFKLECMYVMTPYHPVSHTWINNMLHANRDRCMLVVGQDEMGIQHLSTVLNLQNMPHVTLTHAKKLHGKPLFNVDSLLLLDDVAPPEGLQGTVQVSRLRVVFHDESASPSMEIN